MDAKKFQEELNTVSSFLLYYCEKHEHSRSDTAFSCSHEGVCYTQQVLLCKECFELMEYTAAKLSACPHTVKPRCRKCPNPCYEKKQWKTLAKVMRFSGMHAGVLHVKKRFAKIFFG
jgi:hypothetical protein